MPRKSKNTISSEKNQDSEKEESQQSSIQNDEEEGDDDQDDNSDDDDEEESSEEESSSPEPFLKTMRMRASRGNKMAALENQNFSKPGDLDEEEFWKDNKYFGKIEDVSNDEEEDDNEDFSRDIEEESDSYDKDFGDTVSSGNESGSGKSSKSLYKNISSDIIFMTILHPFHVTLILLKKNYIQ